MWRCTLFRCNSPYCARITRRLPDKSGPVCIPMKLRQLQILCLTTLITCLPASAFAIKLEDAARQAAKQNNAKVLSAKTVKRGNSSTHEIKLLTKQGVVKTVRVPDKGKKK